MADAPQGIVVDVSNPGPPPAEFSERVRNEALARLAAGDADQAKRLLDTLAELEARENPITVVPLDAAQLAQKKTDDQAAAAAADAQRQRAIVELRMQRDRWLAQTDALMLPDAALPSDMPQAVKDAVAANRAKWATFRQQLRDYPSTVTDPLNPPAFPTQPQSPALLLT